MSFAGLFIDLLVAGLLAITIGYCALLNRRLKKMRADEDVMRAVITELVKSTETAERAILGLRATASECNKTISARINEARDIVGHLDRSVAVGRHGTRPQVQTPQAAVPPSLMAAQAPAPQTLAPQPAQPSQAPHHLQAQMARQVQMGHEELSRRMAAEAQFQSQQPFAAPPPVNDMPVPPVAPAYAPPPVQAPREALAQATTQGQAAPASRPSGLYDDLEASLAEIARRNSTGAAA
ncbi:MAG: DUF6468 domain-containing protein [Pseudomonadota bacterium]